MESAPAPQLGWGCGGDGTCLHRSPIFVHAESNTRSHLGTSAPRGESHVPEMGPCRVLGRSDSARHGKDPSARSGGPSHRSREPPLPDQCGTRHAVLAVAKNGRQCIELCRQLLPEILVVDEILPGADGLAIAAIVWNRLPQIRVVLYTFNPKVSVVSRRMGAAGCVVNDTPYRVLLTELRQAVPAPSRRAP